MKSFTQRESEILGEIIRVSNSSLEIDNRLARIVEILAETFSTHFCGLYALRKDKNSFILTASSPRDGKDANSSIISGWEGLMKKVIHSRQPSFLGGDDYPDDNLKGLTSEETAPLSLAFIPIADDRFSYGILLLSPTLSRGDWWRMRGNFF